MMIIKTPRSTPLAAADFLLTACAWLAFLYLFGSGIWSIVHDGASEMANPVALRFLPHMHVLLAYATVSIGIGLLLLAWASYNAKRYGGLDRRRHPRTLAPESLAASFDISPTQVSTLHANQSIWIHHTPEGQISLLRFIDSPRTPTRDVVRQLR
ncbi:MAG TPA: poly-beta-1,6-N-acetyl-D-glucosamine biosynthesis protein PgaD [Castellaniella sp.]|uniref:poly-beta-1,6-N-acetyl-D-glucosamine biosynthesis protein PgaD n=1 Tax=Castellaniella sp. TaxID=1955812 RepID=UPI002EDF3DFA